MMLTCTISRREPAVTANKPFDSTHKSAHSHSTSGGPQTAMTAFLITNSENSITIHSPLPWKYMYISLRSGKTQHGHFAVLAPTIRPTAPFADSSYPVPPRLHTYARTGTPASSSTKDTSVPQSISSQTLMLMGILASPQSILRPSLPRSPTMGSTILRRYFAYHEEHVQQGRGGRALEILDPKTSFRGSPQARCVEPERNFV